MTELNGLLPQTTSGPRVLPLHKYRKSPMSAIPSHPHIVRYQEGRRSSSIIVPLPSPPVRITDGVTSLETMCPSPSIINSQPYILSIAQIFRFVNTFVKNFF